MSRIIKTISVLVMFSILIGAAYAQFAKPEDAIKYRQSVMIIIAQHFGRMGAMVKGEVPYSQEAFADNAAVIEQVSKLPWEAFLTPGSDEGKTTMKSGVLKNPADFKALAQTFETEVGKLAAVAKSGDFDAARARFGAVAQSCKACHSKNRK
ncbi:MAG: cytochrome c [Desulfobacterales bacterium]